MIELLVDGRPGGLPDPTVSPMAVLTTACRARDAWLMTVDDIAQLSEALDWATAIETYLARKNAEGPAEATARRLEARIGELIGPPRPTAGRPRADDKSPHAGIIPSQRHGEFWAMAVHRAAWEPRLPLPRREVLRLVSIAATTERIAAEPEPLPGGPFRVIVADPPWPYDARAEDATHRARLPYPSMTLEAICALPVAEIAADDAVLFLWTTNAFMEEAFDVCRAWGFLPRTILTWAKDRMGLGRWLRGQTEHCLLAACGRPAMTLRNQTTLLHGRVREHSRKPDEFYALVESLCPGSKLELFAREARPGWHCWGADAPGEDVA